MYERSLTLREHLVSIYTLFTKHALFSFHFHTIESYSLVICSCFNKKFFILLHCLFIFILEDHQCDE